MTIQTIRTRVSDLLIANGWTESETPFSFDLQPSGNVDTVFRIESETVESIGGTNFTEERTELLSIWVARLYDAAPEAMYRTLLGDAADIRSLVVRDGHETSGEYVVPDEGGGMRIEREEGRSYATLRVNVPVNYETTL